MRRVAVRNVLFGLAGFAGLALAAGTAAAQSGTYQLLPPNHPEKFYAFRLDTTTGEVAACWYTSGTGIGSTFCSLSGENAGPQGPGPYVLVQNANPTEGGVFRMNTSTGVVSICYLTVDDANLDTVVCTLPGPAIGTGPATGGKPRG